VPWSAYGLSAQWVQDRAAIHRTATVTIPGYSRQQNVPSSWLMQIRSPVSDAVLVDVLPTLTHWPYNNSILVAPGRWSYERALQPIKFDLVTLII
jgi:hypothetical protein